MNISTCYFMGNHGAALCPKNKLSSSILFKKGIGSAVVLFVFALFFSGNIYAQDINKKGKPVMIPKAVSTITVKATAAPLAATTCSACDGKVLNANNPVYTLVAPSEMTGKDSKAKTKSVPVPATRGN